MSKEKAMLVIDMPKSCSECNYGENYESDNGDWCVCNALDQYSNDCIIYEERYINTNHDYYKKRHPNCPLKTMSSGGEVEESIKYIENYFSLDGSYGYTEDKAIKHLTLFKQAFLSQQSELDELKEKVNEFIEFEEIEYSTFSDEKINEHYDKWIKLAEELKQLCKGVKKVHVNVVDAELSDKAKKELEKKFEKEMEKEEVEE